MTIERFQELVNAKPFKPFTIHLADGERIPVASREFVSPSPSGRTIVIWQPDDRMNILDLLLVTNLEVQPANGDRRSQAQVVGGRLGQLRLTTVGIGNLELMRHFLKNLRLDYETIYMDRCLYRERSAHGT